MKVRDPKNLVGVKVEDLVEVTDTQARAIALDKPAEVTMAWRYDDHA